MNENRINIKLGDPLNTCFVVMPFSTLFQTQYEKVIKPTIESTGIECVRGDEIYSKQRIVDDIWDSIKKCRFVLAELTGKNPNVLYEIGLAHAIGKPVIIITRNGEDVPFDLKSLRYLFYDVNDPFWGENLKQGIKSLIEKVIENPTIENYLEGIEIQKDIEYPVMKPIEVTSKINVPSSIYGTWQGSYDLNGPHDITLNIDKKEDEITATCVVSMPDENSVVNQIMIGNYSESRLNLRGVNYTFVRRGKLENYFLDTFDLEFISPNKLEGMELNFDKPIMLEKIN